jgi:hypothetical protein
MEEKKPRGRGFGRRTPESDAVRDVRVELEMTPAQFAQALGCAEGTIRKFEARRSLPYEGDLPARFAEMAKQAGIEVPGVEKQSGQ